MESENTMKLKHLFTSDQKLKWWGNGEWVEEPDEATFVHKGFKCQVMRMVAEEADGFMFGGHLCGYICIPDDHPWRKLDWNNKWNGVDLEPEIHGGLTFYREKEGEYWIGFDCAHLGDLVPSSEALQRHFKKTDNIYAESFRLLDEIKKTSKIPSIFDGVYRPIRYVIGECRQLAEQASKACKPA